MLKKTLFFSLLMLFLAAPLLSQAAGLEERLKGRILLQVEAHGEAWYVNPDNRLRYYLGREKDAFNLMRGLGLGISEADYNRYRNSAPDRLLGKIVLRVHSRGEAYYVNPLNKKLYSLGRPADAFKIMRELGLGISNADLNQIPAEPNHDQVDYFKNEIVLNSSSAYPEEIKLPRGSQLDLRIWVKDYNLSRPGLFLRASNGMSDIPTIWQGGYRDISVEVNNSFSYTPFLTDTNIRLPYEISISVY